MKRGVYYSPWLIREPELRQISCWQPQKQRSRMETNRKKVPKAVLQLQTNANNKKQSYLGFRSHTPTTWSWKKGGRIKQLNFMFLYKQETAITFLKSVWVYQWSQLKITQNVRALHWFLPWLHCLYISTFHMHRNSEKIWGSPFCHSVARYAGSSSVPSTRG